MSVSDLVEVPFEGDFSLRDTLESGQIFHWEEVCIEDRHGYAGCIAQDAPIFMTQDADGRVFTSAADPFVAARYFGLDYSLAEIHAAFPKDDLVLSEAIRLFPGIRIARQPLWECLATFITSSMKQITHIRAISLTLRQRHGIEHEFLGRSFWTYPSPSALARAGEEALRACSLGYRARSLHLAACAVASGELDLDAVETMPSTEQAMHELMRLHGVGEKIACCALLFGAGRWDAFPIDVWMERILRERYRKRVKGAKLQAWATKHFGPYRGYAQQYLFHFARKTL